LAPARREPRLAPLVGGAQRHPVRARGLRRPRRGDGGSRVRCRRARYLRYDWAV